MSKLNVEDGGYGNRSVALYTVIQLKKMQPPASD